MYYPHSPSLTKIPHERSAPPPSYLQNEQGGQLAPSAITTQRNKKLCYIFVTFLKILFTKFQKCARLYL